jgi:hypothetical protein
VKALSLNPSTEKKKEEEKETGTFMIFLFVFCSAGTEPRSLHMLGKYSYH